ncbi:MAG TPA: VWA domain-containing protein, partial [Blastocatellia bacterium]|nr:VWA domain-containing protein [Blastocatellia bacterium]
HRHLVPSTIPWRRAVEETRASMPFRRLRRNLLLLLQLIVLAVFVAALARPALTTAKIVSGNAIVIVDSTASMRSRDESGGRSRLDRAREVVRNIIDSIGEGDRIALVESSSRVVVRCPLTSDRHALNAAVDQIAETDTAGSLGDAVVLAEQIARSEHGGSIVVISDGGGPSIYESAPSPLEEKPALLFIKVGQRSDNAGVIGFSSSRLPSGEEELFASVGNFSDHPRTLNVELRIGGRLFDARSLEVSAHQRGSLVFDGLPITGGLAELKLDVDDDLESDNAAYVYLPDSRRLRVGLASENPFLIRALAANPGVELVRASVNASNLDLVVAEGNESGSYLTTGTPVMAIDPPDVPGLCSLSEKLALPGPLDADQSHPVNAFLNYADLQIEEAGLRTVAPWLRPVVSGGGKGLIWAGDNGKRRVILVGFALGSSDMPLKVEFPILVANSINWLSRRDDLSESVVRAGQPVTVRVTDAGDRSKLRVTTPGGSIEEAEVRGGGSIFSETMHGGVYKVDSGQPFAVTLLSAAESDTTPRDSITTRSGQTVGRDAQTTRSESEVWRWAALAGLLVLAGEWWAYVRRA